MEYITVKALHENMTCIMTQEYKKEFNFGHYKWVIFDIDGNILSASSTCGGPPTGQIDQDEAKEKIIEFIRWSR